MHEAGDTPLPPGGSSVEPTPAPPSTPATTGLAILLAVVFAAQYWWDDGGIATVVRMGACVPELVRAGEWWRLLSYGLLHHTLTHIGMNMLALVQLGQIYERVLGVGGVLVVFVLSVLAGGVAVALMGGPGVTVGASGGLFGLLGVSTWLAIRPGRLLRAEAVGPFRRSVWSTLLLQVPISFLFPVSIAGHVGGGIAGFLLAASRLVLPRADGRRLSPVLGIAGMVALVGAGGMALVQGQPWNLGTDRGWQTYALPSTPLFVRAPRAPRPESGGSQEPEEHAFQVASVLEDGVGAHLFVRRLAAPLSAEQAVALANRTASVPPRGGAPRGETASLEIDGYPVAHRRFTLRRVQIDQWVQVRPTTIVSLLVLLAAEDERPAHAEMGAVFLRGVKELSSR